MPTDLAASWQRLRADLLTVARPDSRFDLDLDSFIPGFDGVEAATERAVASPEFAAAQLIFVTPDNSMQPLRHAALAAGKTIVVPSYGLHRGYLTIDGTTLPEGTALYASWGDGIQHFGVPVPVDAIAALGPIGLVAAGAAAVTSNGVRFGMGFGYLDVEWNMFFRAGNLTEATPVWTIVHDLQVLDAQATGGSDAILVDAIFTPTRVIAAPQPSRPTLLRRETLEALFPRNPDGGQSLLGTVSLAD